jgi:hypothetical protein
MKSHWSAKETREKVDAGRELSGESCGFPYLVTTRMPRVSCTPRQDKAAYAPFCKGKAHKVRGTHQGLQEIGGVGHPLIGLRFRVWV